VPPFRRWLAAVDKDGVEPRTHARLIGESRGDATITLTMRIPERLRPGPNLTPRVSPIVILSLEDLAWHVLTSAAAPSLG
jgi:hypothetical protein